MSDGFFDPPNNAIYVVNLEKGDLRRQSGIIITDDQMKERGIRPRWAQIWKVGIDWQDSFKPGQWILLEHGNWSSIFTLFTASGSSINMQIIEEKSIKRGALGIQDEMPEHLEGYGIKPLDF